MTQALCSSPSNDPEAASPVFPCLDWRLKRLAVGGCISVAPAGTKKGPEGPDFNDLQTSVDVCRSNIGAGNETRTRDPDLGKVVLYQLSYSRLVWAPFYRFK